MILQVTFKNNLFVAFKRLFFLCNPLKVILVKISKSIFLMINKLCEFFPYNFYYSFIYLLFSKLFLYYNIKNKTIISQVNNSAETKNLIHCIMSIMH